MARATAAQRRAYHAFWAARGDAVERLMTKAISGVAGLQVEAVAEALRAQWASILADPQPKVRIEKLLHVALLDVDRWNATYGAALGPWAQVAWADDALHEWRALQIASRRIPRGKNGSWRVPNRPWSALVADGGAVRFYGAWTDLRRARGQRALQFYAQPHLAARQALRLAAYDQLRAMGLWGRPPDDEETRHKALRRQLVRAWVVAADVPIAEFEEAFAEQEQGWLLLQDPRRAILSAGPVERFDAQLVRPLLLPAGQKGSKAAALPITPVVEVGLEVSSGPLGSPAWQAMFGAEQYQGAFGAYWASRAEVTEAQIEGLRSALSAAVGAGENLTATTARVREVFAGTEREAPWRAERIARTETTAARNLGKTDAWKESGAVDKSGWSCSFQNSRETHMQADSDYGPGNEIPLGESFQVGGSLLQYPGDPAGEPKEIINCQCLVDRQVPIFTPNGWKEVGDVEVGDEVLTHKGRFRKVLALMRQPGYKGEVVRLEYRVSARAAKKDKAITVTPEHPVLTMRGWVPAAEIAVGDELVMLGLPCLCCGKPATLHKGGGYCSARCGRSHTAKVQWQDPEIKARQTASMSRAMKRQYEEGKRDPNGVTVAARKAAKGSALNKAMASFLAGRGKHFLAEHPVGRRRVDFYVPMERMFIECDGVAWHQDQERERRRDVEILRQYPDHMIAHVLYGRGDKGRPKWEYHSLATLNHDGQYQPFLVPVVKVDRWALRKARTRWNFAVEEDESYVAKGVAVHNCTLYPVVDFKRGTGDEDVDAALEDAVAAGDEAMLEEWGPGALTIPPPPENAPQWAGPEFNLPLEDIGPVPAANPAQPLVPGWTIPTKPEGA
jgi:hypothetical protein